MANIVKNTDFVGRFRLSQNDQIATDLNNYISELEPVICENLLGAWLYNELMADLDTDEESETFGEFQTQKYKDLVNGVTWVDSCNVTQNLKGLKKVLLHLIYVDWCRNLFYNSNIGNVKPIVETANILTDFENKKYLMPVSKDGVKYYRETIKYLLDTKNYLTYFTATEFALWCPISINPLTLISTNTLENKHFKYKGYDRDEHGEWNS